MLSAILREVTDTRAKFIFLTLFACCFGEPVRREREKKREHCRQKFGQTKEIEREKKAYVAREEVIRDL